MSSTGATVIIAGDVAPTPSNARWFAAGDVTSLLGQDLLAAWLSADARILNLESPLCDEASPIPKNGPHLRAPTTMGRGIAALDPSVVSLANNHILDHGPGGLASTIGTLRDHGLRTTGAGENQRAAAAPCILDVRGRSLGLISCAETEFSGATETTAGANLFDPLRTLDEIEALKQRTDWVIVLHHGGKEGYRYPSPGLRHVCRRMVERGADLVVCQHSHCVGCAEVHGEGTIVYGQGNFIFDGSDDETWRTGLLVRAILGERVGIDYLPLVKRGPAVRLASDDDGTAVLRDFAHRSTQLGTPGFVEAAYRQFASERLPDYLRALAAFGVWTARVDRRILGGRLVRLRFPAAALLRLQNYVQCEAHRELLLAGIAARLGEDGDGAQR